MAKRYTKTCSPLLIIRTINKSIMRYHLILVRMEIIKKSTNNKYWRGFGEKGTFLHCCTCRLSCFSCVQLCATQWTIACPGSSLHGILLARTLECVAIPFSRESFQAGIKPMSLTSPSLAGRLFTNSTIWEAPKLLHVM